MALVQQIVNKAMIFAWSRAASMKTSGGGVQSKEFRDLYETVSQANAENLSYDINRVLTSQFSVEAPCIYTNIHENEHLNASVFTLKEEKEIPIHDHPAMCGLLKVIHGKVRINSFSYLNQPQHDQLKREWENRSGGKRIGKLFQKSLNRWEEKYVMPVIEHPDMELTAADPPTVLSPNERCVHRVRAVDDHAAFFDVLMPPYYPAAGRDCHYFIRLQANEKLTVDDASGGGGGLDVAWLQRIPPPIYYFCDTYEYQGPFAKTLSEAELREEMKKGSCNVA